MYFSTPDRGCVGGAGIVSCTSDAGLTWRTSRLSAPDDLVELGFVSTTDGWARTASGRLFATTDGGGHWRLLAATTRFDSVGFVDPRHGWAVADHQLLASRDGGTTWTPVAAPGSIDAVDFVDASHGWIVTRDGRLLSSVDGGSHWEARSAVPTPTGEAWNGDHAVQVRFADQAVGWLLLTATGCASQSPYLVYHTTDGGGSWSLNLVGPSPCGGTNYPKGPYGAGGLPGSLSVAGSSSAWIPVISCAGECLDVRSTHDQGRTWYAAPPIKGEFSSASLDFPAPRDGWMATRGVGPSSRPSGAADLVLHSADGGRTWRPIERQPNGG